MNGPNEFVLDTNALIAFLQGDLPISETVTSASALFISVITAIEFLAHAPLSPADRSLFETFLSQSTVVEVGGLGGKICNMAIEFRRQRILKLPDAIIAATCIVIDATLISRDSHFERVPGIKLQTF